MKDRLLGMSLSYNRVETLSAPWSEEVFFQGRSCIPRYVADGDVRSDPGVSGFEPVRNVVENTSL